MNDFLCVVTQREELERAVFTAVELANNALASAEVSVKKTNGISISTNFCRIKNVEFNSNNIIEITVYQKNRKGSASSTDLSQKAILRTVKSALDIAHYTSPDPFSNISDKALLAFDVPDLDLSHPIEITLDQAIELAIQTEQASLNVDKRITNTEGSNFSSCYSIKVFGNSYGMLQSYCSTYYILSNCVIAEEHGSMERDYAYTVGRAFEDLNSPEQIGKESANKALSRLSPRRINTMKAPVVFSSEAAVELFSHLIHAISGNAVYRRSTFLLDSLKKQILPNWLNIKEYPHWLKGLASKPFDEEGIRTRNRNIVQNGILNQWLLNNYSARKLGLKSTGHAGGIYNWHVTGLKLEFTEILKEMNTGLLITELMGQGINYTTGDYSRGAFGFWIENGEIQHPVDKIVVSGNLKEMWKNIVVIGNDTETRSNIRCGSVLISEMIIAGQ